MKTEMVGELKFWKQP